MFDNERMTTIQELQERGRELREQVSRSSHGKWAPAPSRPDPIGLLREQDKNRLKQLLPFKYCRMLKSPLTFLRGTAAVMAADLATTPVTGLQAQLCGDAHLFNFGVFATPERKLVFDINDFDETYPGPWEWDLKRLAVSAVLAGRQKGFDDEVNRKLALIVNRYYRETMANLAEASSLDVWYHDMEIDKVLEIFEISSRKARTSVQKVIQKAQQSTQENTIEKLTEVVDNGRQIKNDPPLLVRLNETVTEEQKAWITEKEVKKLFQDYVAGLPEEKRWLMSHFRLSSGAMQIVGTGSIGKRCILLLLEGASKDDVLMLQLKEAVPSILEPYVAKKDYNNQGQRVVIGQKLMQAASDIFLAGLEDSSTGIQYYWRQFKDMKGSFDLDFLDKDSLETYLMVCSVCLARAHARTGNAACISGYIGKSDAFCEAVTDFAVTYADQTERDYLALKAAVKSGHIEAEKECKKMKFY
jgi:uncharacterized protein (DUF2252 family)